MSEDPAGESLLLPIDPSELCFFNPGLIIPLGQGMELGPLGGCCCGCCCCGGMLDIAGCAGGGGGACGPCGGSGSGSSLMALLLLLLLSMGAAMGGDCGVSVTTRCCRLRKKVTGPKWAW